MAQPQDKRPDFASLFAAPSIERILGELNAYQFEEFVTYMIRQAGYGAENIASQHISGIDVKLYAGPGVQSAYLGGVQVKHFQQGNQVTAPDVNKLRGGVSRTGGNIGYFVTTSTFNGPALAECDGSPHIWPIDASHLLRYITYVHGSRPELAEDAEHDTHLHSTTLTPIPAEALFTADKIARRTPEQTKVLTLANHKGGVGKTTTALNFAFGLAALDQQVLLVDMDPQANLTHELSSPHAGHAESMHLGDYFSGRRQLAELVHPTQFSRVWLIPSHNALVLSETGIAAGPEAELRFVSDLHASDITPPKVIDARPFDWIIIDTGPSMGFLTRSALAASHYVIMPLAPGAFADMGPNLFVEAVATMEALIGIPIAIVGCLVTQWKEDRLNTELLAKAKARLAGAGIPLFEAKIPDDKNSVEKAHLETGSGQKKTLFSHHKASKAAQAYMKALGELLGYVNSQKG